MGVELRSNRRQHLTRVFLDRDEQACLKQWRGGTEAAPDRNVEVLKRRTTRLKVV
jgi:hypothetical protein